jgi:hypothetical protein
MPRRPMSAERRAAMSVVVREAMARPEVRQRVSERTRAGKAAAADGAERALRDAWRRAGPEVRRRFLFGLLVRVCHVPEGADG